jgi:hypothetical protein
MRFILMFWDHLPERMAFLHGHDRAWRGLCTLKSVDPERLKAPG